MGVGPAGRDGVLTCRSSGKKQVVCSVGKASAGKSARLVRAGKTVARGTVVRGKVRFRAQRKLSGRYTVVVGSSRTSLRVR